MNKEKFIEKSKEIHKDKYDYTFVEYVDSHKKVKIICPTHGEFEQRPNNHISGKQGCPDCSKTKKLNIKEFIEKSKKIHGDKYDYSKSIYSNNKNLIKIICPIHGEFEQRSESHLKGSNCPKCSIDESRKNEEFITNSKIKHENKYDYSLVEYKRCDKKVKIICPIHGEFEQRPEFHLKRGCPICEGNMKLTTEQIKFIFNRIHKNKYDYSLVQYRGDKIKVKIICSIHGVFEQKPCIHKIGSGCPKCNESKGEKEISKFLDMHKIDYISQKKFSECLDQKELVFDFYLPNVNTCIEYDGEQHFESNVFFGGDKRLEDQKRKDEIKNDFCEKNNIKLIRIKYDENIIDVLKHNKIW